MLYENLSLTGRHRLFSQERLRMQYGKAVMTTELGDHILNQQVILTLSSVAIFYKLSSQCMPGYNHLSALLSVC